MTKKMYEPCPSGLYGKDQPLFRGHGDTTIYPKEPWPDAMSRDWWRHLVGPTWYDQKINSDAS